MKHRILGATLLVAGTTIGAGMLALPMTSAALGLGKSVFLLIAIWAFMVVAALMMVEISQGKGLSIAALSQKRLGSFAKHIASFSLLFLFWSLLSAYISGSSSILHQEIGGPISWYSIIYTLVFGGCVALCTKAVDYANRFLFLIKCVIFFFIIVLLVPFIQGSFWKSMTMQGQSSCMLAHAIPVFFTSFGFHGSLPSLIQYLHGDKKGIYISIICGSFIPLLIYMLWQAMTLGVLGNSADVGGDLGLFMSRLTEKTGKFPLSLFLDLFAFLAIATSFLGVALGLFDYVSEWFVREEGEKRGEVNPFKVGAITFVIPLVFSLFYPQGFVFSLGFAAIFLSILAVVLPSLIAIVQKEKTSFFLRKGFSVVMFLCGIGIIVLEISSKIFARV